MADSLERRPAVRNVAVMEALHGIRSLQPLQQGGIQIQRDADLTARRRVRFCDQELLIGAVRGRRRRQLATVGDQEVVDVVSDPHIVDVPDQVLELLEDHAVSARWPSAPGSDAPRGV